ncbi:TPA: response regulator [Pseudomonas putida]|nr:response regulator [Pseudomonas putida]
MSTVLIVDEQPVARHALRLLLEAEGHVVIGAVGNGAEGVALARQHHPDLMTLELSVPGLGGLEVIQRLVKQAPTVKILVVTAQSTEYFSARCIEAGAFGFISKQDDIRQLILAVNALLDGRTYFPREQARSVVNPAVNIGEESAIKSLSARELTVLEMLTRGLSNNAISEQLMLSNKTISTYKTRLMQKLQAGSPLELLDIARRYGLSETSGFKAEPTQLPILDRTHQGELDLLRGMINAIPHAVNVRDAEGRLIMCNQYFLTQFDVSLEDVLGHRIDESDFLNSVDSHMVHQQFLAAIKSGLPYNVDVLIDVNGQQRVLRHWGHPYRDSSGVIVALICGNVDITDREEIIHDVRDANVKLKQSSMMEKKFISSITGEIKLPLQDLNAMLELVPNLSDPGKQEEALAVARAAARNIQSLLSDFESYLQLEAGSYPFVSTAVNVKELLELHVEKYRDAAVDRHLALELDLSSARHNNVWVDAHVFGRIVDVLLSNALKFTDNGTIGVHLYSSGRGLGLVDVKLRISDSGIGIPIEEQKRVFNAFTQGGHSRRIRRSGSGMGLALCKRMVEQMNGTVLLESREGKGTDISVNLQLAAVRS